MHRSLLVTSRVLLIVVLVAVTYFSLTPSPPSPLTGWDKLAHLLSYVALAFLLVLSVPARRFRLTLAIALFFATFAYGVMIEFVQRMTGRQFELMDMVMNIIGAIVGTLSGIVARWLADRIGDSSIEN